MAQQPTQQGSHIDSYEYIADGNLLLGSHVKKRELEEVSADDQTVRSNNTAANTSSKSLDMSKIGRYGPLTFDP